MLKSEGQKTFNCKLCIFKTDFQMSSFRFYSLQSWMRDCVQPGDRCNRMRLPLNLTLDMLIVAY